MEESWDNKKISSKKKFECSSYTEEDYKNFGNTISFELFKLNNIPEVLLFECDKDFYFLHKMSMNFDEEEYYFNELNPDKKVYIYCRCYNYFERKNARKFSSMIGVVEKFYDIKIKKEDGKMILTNDLPVIEDVVRKFAYNQDMINEYEKIDELKEILDDIKQRKYKDSLNKIYIEIENFGKSPNVLNNLTENDYNFFTKFINTHKGIKHGDNNEKIPKKEVTDLELKVYCDFGLSLYRLLKLYFDKEKNENQLNDKQENINNNENEDIPF